MQYENFHNRLAGLAVAAALFIPSISFADDAGKAGVKVTPLMQKDLTDIPGKEGLVFFVKNKNAPPVLPVK